MRVKGFVKGFAVPVLAGVLVLPFFMSDSRKESLESRAEKAEAESAHVSAQNVPAVVAPVIVPAVARVERVDIQAKPQEVKRSYETSDFSRDDDETLMARVVFGEARSRNVPYWEKVAVAHSILTRKDDRIPYNGEGSIRNVVFYPSGYSCFSEKGFNAENLATIKNPERYDKESWQNALKIADDVLSGRLQNPAPGANLYDLKGCHPKWMKSEKVTRVDVPENFRHGWYRERRK